MGTHWGEQLTTNTSEQSTGAHEGSKSPALKERIAALCREEPGSAWALRNAERTAPSGGRQRHCKPRRAARNLSFPTQNLDRNQWLLSLFFLMLVSLCKVNRTTKTQRGVAEYLARRRVLAWVLKFPLKKIALKAKEALQIQSSVKLALLYPATLNWTEKAFLTVKSPFRFVILRLGKLFFLFLHVMSDILQMRLFF